MELYGGISSVIKFGATGESLELRRNAERPRLHSIRAPSMHFMSSIAVKSLNENTFKKKEISRLEVMRQGLYTTKIKTTEDSQATQSLYRLLELLLFDDEGLSRTGAVKLVL